VDTAQFDGATPGPSSCSSKTVSAVPCMMFCCKIHPAVLLMVRKHQLVSLRWLLGQAVNLVLRATTWAMCCSCNQSHRLLTKLVK
jgi:hypothetical protein